MFEDVCDLFGVPFVGFLAPNRFYIFEVSQKNIAGTLQNAGAGRLLKD